MKTGFLITSVSAVASLCASQLNSQPFQFKSEQSVYVVAADSASRDLSVTKADLETERLAKNQFVKEKKFRLARTVSEADFVFFLLVDSNSRDTDELALAVLPSDYVRCETNLDALRNAAVWQESAHFRVKDRALAGATI